MEDVGAVDLTSAPEEVTRCFDSTREGPASAAKADFGPGICMFHRNSHLVLRAMVGGTLAEGIATDISKSFFDTGHLRDSSIRRLQQHNRHMVEIFNPGDLDHFGSAVEAPPWPGCPVRR